MSNLYCAVIVSFSFLSAPALSQTPPTADSVENVSNRLGKLIESYNSLVKSHQELQKSHAKMQEKLNELDILSKRIRWQPMLIPADRNWKSYHKSKLCNNIGYAYSTPLEYSNGSVQLLCY